ncbi:hypothetical protein ACFQ3K_04110 [Brucella gallinifaecis]|uniref:DUF945 domain-containing protein n=1 Tax=Brucella gallinifaecis TaxID=215590 RepID=A0A502BP54_9HYPH|nr:hypothetical protein [Brucella gallinifaecis]TPF75066.1 hypothetical protein FHY56_10070 [Brucella gallinifaecis]
MQFFVFNSQAARILAASTALSAVLASTAMAADANAVAERIKLLYAQQGGELTFAEVQTDGDDVLLKGATIKLPTVSDNATPVGDVKLENVQDSPEGGYSIEKVSIADMDFPATGQSKNDKASIKGISMENVILPSEQAKDALEKMVFYDKMKIDEVAVGTPGTDGVLIKGVEVSLNSANKAEKIDYALTIANIDAAFEKNDKNPLAPLDMHTLNGSISSRGSWQPASGNATLDQFEINADKLGKIDLTGSIDGYDLAFVEAVQKTQANMAKADADHDAAGLALLGLAEQLSLKNLTIRFDNETLTQKLLDYYGKQQGADGKQLGEQLKMMVPLMATQLKNPEFAQQLKAAADKYFDDPKSLTISASPDQSVSLASIVATVSLDPTKIIPLLKIGVEANN